MEGWKRGEMEGWKRGEMEGWKNGRMEGRKDGRMEGWKRCFCLDRRLRGFHEFHGEERLLSARFSFNAGTSARLDEVKKPIIKLTLV